MRNPRAGGSIYIWTLGANRTAHAVAREFGHAEGPPRVMKRTPEAMQLAAACDAGDEALIKRLLAARPDLASTLTADDRRTIADAAQANNAAAVRLMLEGRLAARRPRPAQRHAVALGRVPRQRRDGACAARAWAPGQREGDEYNGTPLGWAIHGAEHGWHRKTGAYAETMEVLRAAGGTTGE
jgi:hypothetical protein